MRRFMFAVTAMAAVQASAQTPVPAAAPTLQQQYEAATALDATGTPAQRLAAWEALERRPKFSRRSVAIFRSRKAVALTELGRLDEAVAAARASLADLPSTDPSLGEDRGNAWLAIGQINREALDYPGAIAAFREAEKTPSQAIRIAAWIGLYQTEPHVDPKAAAATVARVAPLVAAMNPGRDTLALFARYDAERLLNAGDFAAAKARAMDAVRLNGGLTNRTSIADVPARSDVAIAALLTKDMATAREYMAMTGAGRSTKGAFVAGAQMVPPDCGGDSGLRPEDVAIVEFSVADDGRVLGSQPVYSAGGGRAGLEFARAVRGWSWTPEQLKDLPVFYRIRTRIELRCSTAFQRPGIAAYLDAALGRWLDDRKVTLPPMPTGSDAEMLPKLRAGLAAAEARDGAAAPAVLPWLLLLVRNTLYSRDETHAAAVRALAILDANRGAPAARLSFQLIEWQTREVESRRRGGILPLIRTALADPAQTADAETRTALRLIYVDNLRARDPEALTVLRAVHDDTGLDRKSALWTAAMAQLASLEQQAGNSAAAAQAFEASGLSAEQCALVDRAPKMLHASGEYPNEALMWGFDGWVRLQHDVTAEGRTTNARAVMAYPPFIFNEAALTGIAGARYAKSYRPDGGLGCGGTIQGYRFIAP